MRGMKADVGGVKYDGRSVMCEGQLMVLDSRFGFFTTCDINAKGKV